MPTIYTGLSTLFPPCLATLAGRVYLANDDDPLLAWDGSWPTMRPAGIAAPDTPPGAPVVVPGSVTTGLHRVRYRYVDRTADVVSNPSDEIILVANGTTGWTFQVGSQLAPSSDAKVTHIALEASLANGTEFYRVGLVPNTNGAIIAYTVADTALMFYDPTDELHGDFGHGLPPLTALVCAHRGRLFAAGGYERIVTGLCTNDSDTVTGTQANPRWIGRTAIIESSAYRVIDATTTTLKLDRPFSGTTGTKSITIRPRGDVVYWSRAMRPESWDRVRWQRSVVAGDTVTALASFDNELWVFGTHSVDRLAYTRDPGIDDGVVIPVSRLRGAVSQRCLVHHAGRMYVLDSMGVYTLPDMTDISAPVQRLIQKDSQWSTRLTWCGFAIPDEDTVGWITLREASQGIMATRLLCYQVSSQRWWTEVYNCDIRDIAPSHGPLGQHIVLAGDDAGRVWQLRAGDACDGLQNPLSALRTVGSGASTTVIPLNSTADLSAGMVVERAQTGERCVVSSVGTSTITLAAPGFAQAPAAGEAVLVGPIDMVYETKWIAVPGRLGQRVYLHVRLRPAGVTSWMRARFYRDFSDTAETLTVHDASYAFPLGVRLGDGTATSADYMSFDINRPSVSVPVPLEWTEYWRVRLEHSDPRATPRILDIVMSTVESPPWAEV